MDVFHFYFTFVINGFYQGDKSVKLVHVLILKVIASMITSISTKIELAKKKRKRSFFYTFLLLIFLSLVIALIYAIAEHNISQDREEEQYRELADIEENIIDELDAAGVDLTYYAHSDLAISTLSSQDKTAKSYLASLMFNISSLHKRYDQIRLFDEQGNEVIRIDQLPDFSLQQIADDQLQNKLQRYYFQKSLHLKPSEIYVSKFDLNKEFGEVEYPIKPMIRFITPVYSKDNEHIGVGIINYNGKQILKIIDERYSHKRGLVYLLNESGYYLKSENPNKEWAFMFPEKEQFRFSTDQPDVWEKIQTLQDKKVTNKSGEYYVHHFYLSPSKLFNVVNAEGIFLVIHVPNDVISAELKSLIYVLMLIFLFIAPVLCFLAYKLAHSQVEQDWLFEKLHFDANHDALTGLYNRQAIVNSLEKHISLSQRRKSSLSVAFIDVNDLKKMNDVYGHEAGDALIRGLAVAINSSIRNSDFAARLGGDEFLIVCVDCDQTSAEQTMQRIQDNYGASGRQVGQKWSMSFGCTELQSKSDDVDSMIDRADSAMYKHKKKMKQQDSI